MNRTYPNIPILKNCVLALYTDVKNQSDHVLIGELGEIRRILNGSNDAKVIINSKRPIGSFVADCMQSIPRILSDIRTAFATGEEVCSPDFWNANMEELNQLYASNNLCFKFYALRIWQEYKARQEKAKKHYFMKHDTDPEPVFADFVDDLTFPSELSLESDIMKIQSEPFDSPLEYVDHIFLNGTAEFFYTCSKGLREYIVADQYMMPMMIYSLNEIYNNHQYFQRCKVCNKLFLAHTANIPTLCSDECRREQSRLNKRRYDSIKKNISYEKNYKNNYMYWYNKLEKLKEMDKVDYHPFEKAFQTFCMDARVKKRAVKNGSFSVSSFDDWMLTQRTKADKIMSQILEGQSHNEE